MKPRVSILGVETPYKDAMSTLSYKQSIEEDRAASHSPKAQSVASV